MNLLIRPDGIIECIYAEDIDLSKLGDINIQRASYVEPSPRNKWYARIIGDTTLGPFAKRTDAITAEVKYLLNRMEQGCQHP